MRTNIKNWFDFLSPIFIFIIFQATLNFLLMRFSVGNSSAIVTIIMFPFALFAYFLMRHGKKENANVTGKPFRWIDFLKCSLIVILFVVITIVVSESTHVNKLTVLSILSMVLLGPTNEEIFYRGISFVKGERLYGVATSMFITSLLFAVTHKGIKAIILAFALGCILCIVQKKHGRIEIVAIMHILINLFLTIYYYIF
ncbi:MAG: CPBP family intramembrane metalloprotease [Ruminococcaceae bacterium]|nr:CPBP family intramembrane metalloprotease [Oscillospiraceae bacterium]